MGPRWISRSFSNFAEGNSPPISALKTSKSAKNSPKTPSARSSKENCVSRYNLSSLNAELTRHLQRIAQRLRSSLYLVGGPVRDALLHRPCHDWDFVCRHARRVARETAKTRHAKFIALDEQNRIYRVILPDGVTLDFAELQGKTIQEDLARRDFTINAMARGFPDGEIIDPHGGQRDLRNKTVRALAARAFVEDPLRTLRTFRFSAQLQFKIERRTLAWVQKHRAGLQKVSAERIREELLRLFQQSDAGPALRLMDRVRLLSEIFPEREACRRSAIRYYGTGGVLKHSFETLENLEWILQQIERGSERAGEGGKSWMFLSLTGS